MKTTLIKAGQYFDSVTLMGVSKRLLAHEGIRQVSVSMGTDLNKALLVEAGLASDATNAATPNDLMIVLETDETLSEADALALIDAELTRKTAEAVAQHRPINLAAALDVRPDANLALISVPGQYATLEAKKALTAGLNVMLFSDNVSVEDEVALKTLAHEKGLFVMGPDCGTAIINQVPLCFANAVNAGNVGLIGASGTGMQEVSVLLDAAGLGISQAIGTGGRDLKDAVGARMTLDAIDALEADPATDLLVVVGKAPEAGVMDTLVARAQTLTKPIVFTFLSEKAFTSTERVRFTQTLEGALTEVLSLLGMPAVETIDAEREKALASSLRQRLNAEQTAIRGVFCGGTLTSEARLILHRDFGLDVYSNIAHDAFALSDTETSRGHTLLDMGDDTFTVGRAHPMIDPTVRNERLRREGLDPEVAVVLFDVVLGTGANADPLPELLATLESIREETHAAGRDVALIAYVLGTDKDLQGKASVVAALKALGVTVATTNAQAARLAGWVVNAQ